MPNILIFDFVIERRSRDVRGSILKGGGAAIPSDESHVSTQLSACNVRKEPCITLRHLPRTFPGNPTFQLRCPQAIPGKNHAVSYYRFLLEDFQVIASLTSVRLQGMSGQYNILSHDCFL